MSAATLLTSARYGPSSARASATWAAQAVAGGLGGAELLAAPAPGPGPWAAVRLGRPSAVATDRRRRRHPCRRPVRPARRRHVGSGSPHGSRGVRLGGRSSRGRAPGGFQREPADDTSGSQAAGGNVRSLSRSAASKKPYVRRSAGSSGRTDARWRSATARVRAPRSARPARPDRAGSGCRRRTGDRREADLGGRHPGQHGEHQPGMGESNERERIGLGQPLARRSESPLIGGGLGLRGEGLGGGHRRRHAGLGGPDHDVAQLVQTGHIGAQPAADTALDGLDMGQRRAGQVGRSAGRQAPSWSSASRTSRGAAHQRQDPVELPKPLRSVLSHVLPRFWSGGPATR